MDRVSDFLTAEAVLLKDEPNYHSSAGLRPFHCCANHLAMVSLDVPGSQIFQVQQASRYPKCLKALTSPPARIKNAALHAANNSLLVCSLSEIIYVFTPECAKYCCSVAFQHSIVEQVSWSM